MKKTLFALLLLLGSAVPRLLALNPETPAPRFEHLATINPEWARQMLVPEDPALLQTVVFNSDRDRIREHFRWVELLLRQNPNPGLSTEQRLRRQHHLDVLHRYGQAGTFPTNHFHTQRRPYFRDNFNVLCAVGNLLWQDGQQALVERINRENNSGYLRELAERYPEIAQWARQNGFTVDELALIQPGYDPARPTFETWGTGIGLNPGGRINVLEKNATGTLLFAAGLFSEIDGVAANNIAVWDGTSWSPLGAGVNGEVFALHFFYQFGLTLPAGLLYVGGQFSLPDAPTKRNVAECDLNTGVWRGLQSGDMEGTVYSLRRFPSSSATEGLFVVGDFQKVNHALHPYTGICNPNDATWNFNNHFKTDGPVRVVAAVDNLPMIGGDFEQVFSPTTQTWIDAPHFAYYTYQNWLTIPNNLPPVRSLFYHEGNVFAGSALDCTGGCTGMSILKAGFWWNVYQQSPHGDSLTHGFFAAEGRTYAFGGFHGGTPFSGKGTGMAYFDRENTTPYGVFITDGTVRAGIYFQGKIHVAGDFQHLWYDEEAFPGLARFTPNYSYWTSTGSPAALALLVKTFSDRLVLPGEGLDGAAQLRVFDLQGRLVAQKELLPGQGDATIEASALPAGLYLWQVQVAGRTQAGKWVVPA